MGYYDIRQIPLFLAANDKRPVPGKPWTINHCQHLSGLPPPGVGNGFAPHHYDSTMLKPCSQFAESYKNVADYYKNTVVQIIANISIVDLSCIGPATYLGF